MLCSPMMGQETEQQMGRQMGQQTERQREQQFTYYWYAARQAQEAKEYDRALMLLLLCEQLNPKDAMTQETIGLLYWGTGRNLEAINYLARAFVLDPGAHWQAYYGLLEHFSAEVENTRSLETKRDILKTAAEASPKDAELWETLATVYVQLEDWTNTLDALDHIEEIQGADARCATMRYRIYRYLKKDKQAQKALEDHLAINPDEDVILGMLIDILNEKKAPLKKLRPLYERYLLLNPMNDHILNNYAWALATQKTDLDYAETLVLRAMKLDDENVNYVDTYAWILHLKGEHEMARYYIRKAMQMVNPASDLKDEIMKHYKTIYT